MTSADDWNAVSSELEEIKAIAHHKGYEKAIEDMAIEREELADKRRKISQEVSEWHAILNIVRDSWSKHTGQPASWQDPQKDKYRYQVLFGTDNKRIGTSPYSTYVNFPEDLEHFTFAFHEITRMAADFQILIETFNSNPIIKAQWDRLLVAMRMTQTT